MAGMPEGEGGAVAGSHPEEDRQPAVVTGELQAWGSG